MRPENIRRRISMYTTISTRQAWISALAKSFEGDLPAKQTRLVLAWAELHQDELMADWRLVTNGEHPFKIEPLK